MIEEHAFCAVIKMHISESVSHVPNNCNLYLLVRFQAVTKKINLRGVYYA